MPRRPHKLDLYRLAVQHPEAEAAFLMRAYAHYRGGAMPTRLREDFAGTAAVAAHFVELHDDHRALAVESHGPTLRWAERRVAMELGDRAEDLIFIEADAAAVGPPDLPKVDVTAALNFSVFIYHTRDALRDYFRSARRGLRPGGLLLLDAYGGPGAMRVGEQRRPVSLPRPQRDRLGLRSLQYRWEQRTYDAVTGRVDCRIHFAIGETGGHERRIVRNVFRYDWRLWTLPELCEVLTEAGFSRTDVWCEATTRAGDRGGGRYRPTRHMPAREDWVAYVVGVR